MILSSKQRKLLESMAHDLEPAVRIGKFGVTPTLVQTVHESLTAQELIKIKILENAEIEKEEAAEILVEKTKASLIQIIGRIIILYRANPERKHRIEFPGMEPSTGATPQADDDSPAPKKRPYVAKRPKGKPTSKSQKAAIARAGNRKPKTRRS